MNGDGTGYLDYLQALETLFVGKAASDLSRSSFSIAAQERNEPIPLFASRLQSLFSSAFPNETNLNDNVLIIDRFYNGIKNENQKRVVLQKSRKVIK